MCASLLLLLGWLRLGFASGGCIRFWFSCELSNELANHRFLLRLLFILGRGVTSTELDLIVSLSQLDLQLGRSLLVLLDLIILAPQRHCQLITLHVQLRPHHLRVHK